MFNARLDPTTPHHTAPYLPPPRAGAAAGQAPARGAWAPASGSATGTGTPASPVCYEEGQSFSRACTMARGAYPCLCILTPGLPSVVRARPPHSEAGGAARMCDAASRRSRMRDGRRPIIVVVDASMSSCACAYLCFLNLLLLGCGMGLRRGTEALIWIVEEALLTEHTRVTRTREAEKNTRQERRQGRARKKK